MLSTRLHTACSPSGDLLTTHHPGESYSLLINGARRFFLITNPVLVSALTALLAAKPSFKLLPWWDNSTARRSGRPPRVILVFKDRMQTTVIFLEDPPASELTNVELMFPQAHVVTPPAMKPQSSGAISSKEGA